MKESKLFGRLIKNIVAVIVIIFSISMIPQNAYAESNYALLAQYYEALANQGGNAEMTADEARQMAAYYADLAAKEAAGEGATATPVVAGTTLQVVNQGASDEFWQKMYGQVNSMPEAIKKIMSKYNVVYYCVRDGGAFGIYGASGLTQTTCTQYGRGKRKVSMEIYLAEYSNNDETLHTIYHETAHALDKIHWKEAGVDFCQTTQFVNAMQGEIEAMYSLYTARNLNANSDEYYADAFATFYIHNAQMANVCPKTFAYFIATAPK